MTRMTISLTNNTPYNVVYVSYDGSDWSDDSSQYPTNTTLNVSSGTAQVIQSMGCPRAGGGETDHWGWLNFRAEVPGLKGFFKWFFIYARQQNSSRCDGYGMGKAASEHDHPDLDKAKFGTSTYTPDYSNGGSQKLECVLNVHDLDWST